MLASPPTRLPLSLGTTVHIVEEKKYIYIYRARDRRTAMEHLRDLLKDSSQMMNCKTYAMVALARSCDQGISDPVTLFKLNACLCPSV